MKLSVAFMYSLCMSWMSFSRASSYWLSLYIMKSSYCVCEFSSKKIPRTTDEEIQTHKSPRESKISLTLEYILSWQCYFTITRAISFTFPPSAACELIERIIDSTKLCITFTTTNSEYMFKTKNGLTMDPPSTHVLQKISSVHLINVRSKRQNKTQVIRYMQCTGITLVAFKGVTWYWWRSNSAMNQVGSIGFIEWILLLGGLGLGMKTENMWKHVFSWTKLNWLFD